GSSVSVSWSYTSAINSLLLRASNSERVDDRRDDERLIDSLLDSEVRDRVVVESPDPVQFEQRPAALDVRCDRLLRVVTVDENKIKVPAAKRGQHVGERTDVDNDVL